MIYKKKLIRGPMLFADGYILYLVDMTVLLAFSNFREQRIIFDFEFMVIFTSYMSKLFWNRPHILKDD
jgi:hypothetical protein